MDNLIDFLYDAEAWKTDLAVSVIVVTGAVLTLILVNRFRDRGLRRHHSDIAGFFIAVMGVIFAIAISFVAILVPTRQDHAQTLVVQEPRAIDRGSDLDAVIDKARPEMRCAHWPRAAVHVG